MDGPMAEGAITTQGILSYEQFLNGAGKAYREKRRGRGVNGCFKWYRITAREQSAGGRPRAYHSGAIQGRPTDSHIRLRPPFVFGHPLLCGGEVRLLMRQTPSGRPGQTFGSPYRREGSQKRGRRWLHDPAGAMNRVGRVAVQRIFGLSEAPIFGFCLRLPFLPVTGVTVTCRAAQVRRPARHVDPNIPPSIITSQVQVP